MNTLLQKFQKHIGVNLLLIATCITLFFFGWTLFAGRFFSDDFTWLWHGQKIDLNLVRIFTYKMSSFYSPVLNTYYTVLYSIAGYQYWVYFLIDLGVHILVSTLAGLWLYTQTHSKPASFLATALIALTGIAYEPLVWVASNLHSIATLFILLSVVSYQYLLHTKKKRFALITGISVLFALGTKEIAVITGLLLLLTLGLHLFNQQERKLTKPHILLILFVFFSTSIYLYYQYLWQAQSLTVNEAWWNPSFSAILRFPLIFLDFLIPIHLFISAKNAVVFSLLSLAGLSTIVFIYRKHLVIWYGIFWSIICTLPTIFFITPEWFSPLASRYTYLPRIGFLLAIASLYPHLKKPIHSFFYFGIVAISALTQIHFMYMQILIEYPFVYQTGDSLIEAIDEANNQGVTILSIAPNRPFEYNPAHIVGAIETRTTIREPQIYFLETIEEAPAGSAIIYWDKQTERYQVQ